MKEYIEREVVLSKLHNHYPKPDDMIASVVTIPAAYVVEVRRGRWEVGGMFDDIGRCSACHYMFPIDTATTEFHFCPNCGAKMSGGVEEER